MTMAKTFKQFLIETPIGDYKTIGDFSRNSSFRKKRDRTMIQNPRAIEITKKKFDNNENVFNLYFVNSKEADKFTEVGVVTLDWLKQNLGDEVYNAVAPNIDNDAINVVFINNKGVENMPMTPWIMAHRIAHALGRTGGSRKRQIQTYDTVSDTIFNVTGQIMDYYGYTSMPDSEREHMNRRYGYSNADSKNSRRNELILKHLFTQVCTFRSARKNEIRDWFEVLHELFAQYITTGNIKFKPAPNKVGSSHTGVFWLKNGAEEDVNDLLGMLSRDLKYLFDDMLGEAVNKVLVM